MGVESSMPVILQRRPYGPLSFQNGGESNENTLEIRLTNIRYINSPAQTQLFSRLFPRKFQCSPSFNALLRVELAIYPMFIYKRLLMFSIDIHLNSCFSSLDILAIFLIRSHLSIYRSSVFERLSMNGACLYHFLFRLGKFSFLETK